MKRSRVILLTALPLLLSSCVGNSDVPDGAATLSIAFAEAGFGRTFLQTWQDLYNEAYPEEKIYLDLEGDSQMTTSYLPRLQSGRNLPDIFMVLSTNWQADALKGYLEPIDDVYASEVFDKPGTKIHDYIQDNFQEFGKVGDHYYAMPWSVGPGGLVYNVSMFQQYNWKVPETFEELVALCDQIKSDTAGTVAPFAWSGQTAAYWDFFTKNIWAQFEGEEGWKAFWDFGSPEVFKQTGRLKALEAFETLICDAGSPKNSIEGASAKTFMQAQMSFINSEAAMIPNGCWIENEIKTSLPTGFKMAMMKTPKMAGSTHENLSCNTSGDFMVVPAKAAHKDLAKKFLAFISSERCALSFSKDAGGLRPFKYEPSKIEGISDFSKGVFEIYENSTNLFDVSNNPMYYQNFVNVWPSYGTPYSRMIQDEETPQEVINAIYNYVSSHWSTFQKQAGITD